jgi:hypothetical protein
VGVSANARMVDRLTRGVRESRRSTMLDSPRRNWSPTIVGPTGPDMQERGRANAEARRTDSLSRDYYGGSHRDKLGRGVDHNGARPADVLSRDYHDPGRRRRDKLRRPQ